MTDKRGLRITSKIVQQISELIGDGVALTSMEHPPGLIEAMAEAIRTGKLSLKRRRDDE